MDADTVIIDISSDEENCADDSFDISDEWINELLGCVDIEVQGDLDDIMVLDGLSAPSCLKKSSPLQKDSDDDCLVLDSDPDKLVVDYKQNSDAFDDLVIIGEKGQLACRDYPHPRHLCVNFPFNSTPHEKHCKLCHCYVCDSPAPCIYWGIGILATDHCHSSDEGKGWKALRNIVKRGPSKPLYFPGSNQPHTQFFRSSQNIYNPAPCSQSASRRSTTGSATAIPVPSIESGIQLPGPSIFRTRPVNQGTFHRIETQSNPSSHSSVRTVPLPTYTGSTSNGSSSSSSQGLAVSKPLQRTAARKFPYSDLQRSHRKPVASPQANNQLIQPEASNNMNRLRGILASIEADLLGTDNYS